jgi:ribosomal protein S8
LPVFCPESDITDIYAKKNYLNEYATEEEYMQDFWITLKLLRRRYEEVNPIIKIQKVFRGWIFREKLRR